MYSDITTTLPLVSVIMPAYNAGRYIAEAIQSIQAQTYSRWELVIIDDGSVDNTAEVVQSFLADARVQYHDETRIGHAAGTRNRGIQKARGELIAFLDSDDVFEPETLSLFVEHMIKNADCNAVYGFLQRMTEDGQLIPNQEPFLERDQNGQTAIKADYEHTWKNILTSRTVHQMSFMARAELFKTIGLFNEELLVGEDFEFYIRMFLHDFEGVQFIPRYVYRYRTYPESICNDIVRFNKVLSNQRIFFKHVFEELSLPPEAMKHRSEFIGRLYGYYARTRYVQQQTEQVQACVWAAWGCQDLEKTDWFKYCLPIVVRSSLGRLDTVLTQCYWLVKGAVRKRSVS